MIVIDTGVKKYSLPPSTANLLINFVCLFFFFAVMFFLHYQVPRLQPVHITIISLLAIAIPLWVYDFLIMRVHTRASTGLSAKKSPLDKNRLVIKLIGLFGTLLIILGIYAAFPIYHSKAGIEFYGSFFYFLNLTGPWIIVLSVIYFYQIDRHQIDPYDEYWHTGCLLTGQCKKVSGIIVKEHIRAWFIKGFFTPFMFSVLVVYVKALLSYNWNSFSFLSFHDFLLNIFYSIDVIYGVLGYILTLRLLDTHIRSTDPTYSGWFVCLICYHPFSTMFGFDLFGLDDGFYWNHWFAFSPVIFYFWAFVIIFLIFVYALATVAFGYRMSNLTYRGIITSGPYQYTKHPAYLCKVLSWWLIALPFYSVEGPWMAVTCTMSLSIISIIYYLRARTEENHLSNYPEYVAYANWINEHGIFKFIAKYFPALAYSEEKCKQSKSVVWFKKLGMK